MEFKICRSLVYGGSNQPKHDYSVFARERNGKIIILIVYLDDVLITEGDKEGISELKRFLNSKFLIKDLGALKYFLEIEI